MLVKNYNIGRRDCVLTSNGKENLLIDCGVTKQSSVISEIDADLFNKESSLLITHFHDDHIGGLRFISSNSIEHIYMSKFVLCVFKEENISILIKLLKFMAYSTKRSDTRTMIQNIFSVFKIISNALSLTGNIHFVNRGDKIYMVSDFHVLHPDVECSSFLDIVHNEMLDKFIQDTESYMNDQVKAQLDGIIGTFISQHMDMRGMLKQVFDHTDSLEISRENLHQGLIDYHNEKLMKIIEFADKNIGLWINNHNLFTEFSNQMNEKSVIIQNENSLFTGDATISVINALERSKYFDGMVYKLIKTPHHGAKNFYADKLPDADIYISCSNSQSLDINNGNTYLLKRPKVYHVFSDGSTFHFSSIKLNNVKTHVQFNI